MNIEKLTAHLAALGIDAPAEVVAVQEIRVALGTLRTNPPVFTFEHDIATGAISAKNCVKRVQEAAAALAAHEKAVEVCQVVEPALARRERRALVDAGDDLVIAMRPAFDQAAAAAGFVSRFGSDPDAAAVLSAGGGSDVWRQYQAALVVFDATHRVMDALAEARYCADPRVSWYVEAITDSSRAVSTFSNSGKGIAALLAQGYKLRLNLAAEAVAVVANVAAVRARRDEAEAQAKADEKARLMAERQRIEAGTVEQRQAMAAQG